MGEIGCNFQILVYDSLVTADTFLEAPIRHKVSTKIAYIK